MLRLQPLLVLNQHPILNSTKTSTLADQQEMQMRLWGSYLLRTPSSCSLCLGPLLWLMSSFHSIIDLYLYIYSIDNYLKIFMYEGQGDHAGQHHQQYQHQHHQQENQQHYHAVVQPVDPVVKLNSALNLAKVMPPSKLKKNLIGLTRLAPQIQDNLLQKIELPMQIDQTNPNYPFLKTQFNRDGNSYRNPYTNHYSPQNSSGYRPSGLYRGLEESGSVLFAEYVKQYYGGNTVGNFFVMEGEQGNGDFSCGFFAKKNSNQGDGFEGSWDSFNIIDVTFDGHSFHYKLNTTILIQMDISNNGINLTGFLKKNKQEQRAYPKNLTQTHPQTFQNHLVVIGEMVEQMQTTMRQHLQAIYVAKTKQIIFTTRFENTIGLEKDKMSLANQLKKVRFGNQQ